MFCLRKNLKGFIAILGCTFVVCYYYSLHGLQCLKLGLWSMCPLLIDGSVLPEEGLVPPSVTLPPQSCFLPQRAAVPSPALSSLPICDREPFSPTFCLALPPWPCPLPHPKQVYRMALPSLTWTLRFCTAETSSGVMVVPRLEGSSFTWYQRPSHDP